MTDRNPDEWFGDDPEPDESDLILIRAKGALENLRLAGRTSPVLKDWCDEVAAGFASLAESNLAAIRELESEKDSLRERLGEWEADVRAVMDDPCHDGAHHCTCVPLLRDEVRRLRSCLRFIEAQPEVFGRNAVTYAADAIANVNQYGAAASLGGRAVGHSDGSISTLPGGTHG